MYILIVNDQPLGRSLVASLVAHGHEVAYVDEDIEFCNMVTADVGCLVIHGESTNLLVLEQAGISRADVVVALLEKDIKNVMIGLFAKQHGVARILGHLQQQHYLAAYELAGIDVIFSAFDFLLNQLLMAIEEPNVRQVMSLGSGDIEIAAIDVPANSPFLDHDLSSLWEHKDFPSGALLLGLLEADDQVFHLPRERQRVVVDDELLVLGSPDDIHQINLILSNARQGFLRGGRSNRR